MNSNKTVLLGFAAALSLAPFLAHAKTGQIGLQACAEALVTKLSANNGSSVGYRVDDTLDNFDTRLKKREIISLYATDVASNELVSRMDCIVDRWGRVIRLETLPVDTEEADKLISRVQ
jgi:hypothetical protein